MLSLSSFPATRKTRHLHYKAGESPPAKECQQNSQPEGQQPASLPPPVQPLPRPETRHNAAQGWKITSRPALSPSRKCCRGTPSYGSFFIALPLTLKGSNSRVVGMASSGLFLFLSRPTTMTTIYESPQARLFPVEKHETNTV